LQVAKGEFIAIVGKKTRLGSCKLCNGFLVFSLLLCLFLSFMFLKQMTNIPQCHHDLKGFEITKKIQEQILYPQAPRW
jgi:hypothetical protein